jgi:hypothetical protein
MRKSPPEEDLRPEYKRADFNELVRGKYIERLEKGSVVVVPGPPAKQDPPSQEGR